MISNGHPPAVAWKYTPRQLQGWVGFIYRQRLADRAERLMVAAQAARGEGKDVRKMMKSLMQESR